MGPPAGFSFSALLPKLLAVLSRQTNGGFPKLGPGGMSTAGLGGAVGGHVEGAAAALLGPGEIEVGAVAALRIAMASTVGVAAGAGGLRKPALDHGPGGAQELVEELLPNHIIMLGNPRAKSSKKAHLSTTFTGEMAKIGLRSAAFCARK